MAWFKRFALMLMMACLLAALPARAQSILRDAETEAYLNDISRPLIEAAGLSPQNVRIILINSKEINAFVAGGQAVYIHSGLIDAAGSSNEIQGVIAHELGHVVGGHVPLQGQIAKGATGISLLSLALGVAAIAAGAGEAGAGILAAGQRAAIGSYLAYSRQQEAQTDAAGVRFLNGAGISGRGMLEFFKRLQNLEYRLAIPQNNAYERTHPLTGQRLAFLTDELTASPNFNKPSDPALELRFRRVQAKLRGYVNDPQDTLRMYPASDTSVPARYARAYAWHKSGYPKQAEAETDALIALAPNDPYFLELEGQILLESGKPVQALVPLRAATDGTRSNPLIATTFGHALIATENPANLDEAEAVLRLAVNRDNENPFAWFQLGTVYARKGDTARTALATAERASITGDFATAMRSASAAVAGLPQGSNDWLRAQDILITTRSVLADRPELLRR
ncbi:MULTISPECIES: M48 family metalloprotease [unclassified Sphingomonas]|uniref:M48 family metalloprotease n=1 Tax=unclassified Sphingomonas TaxID=196159 RepID=UPI0009E8F5B9|nr:MULTISPECIES: M48 family metalloprotease [unclassified Sphingomonas]